MFSFNFPRFVATKGCPPPTFDCRFCPPPVVARETGRRAEDGGGANWIRKQRGEKMRMEGRGKGGGGCRKERR